MPTVLRVESNIHSTSKQDDPSCEHSGANAVLRAALTLSNIPHALNIIHTGIKGNILRLVASW